MSVDSAAGSFASAHHGVITRGAALGSGLTDHAIRERVESGRWIRAAQGIYVIAGSVPTHRQRVTVACLDSPGAAASHATAGRLHRLGYLPPDQRIHITVGRPSSGRSRSAVVHRSRDLTPIDVSMIDGLPVTSIERTLLDLAGVVHGPRLGRIVDHALDHGLVTWDALAHCLLRHAPRGRPGSAALRSAVEARGDGLAVTQSRLERRFVEFCELRGLPRPTLQHRLDWRGRVVGRADVVFPAVRVIVELDGRLGHQQLTDQESDRIRDQEAAAAGWLTLRVSWDQLHLGGDALEERVRAVLDLRRQEQDR